jgi:hypothetical protein
VHASRPRRPFPRRPLPCPVAQRPDARWPPTRATRVARRGVAILQHVMVNRVVAEYFDIICARRHHAIGSVAVKFSPSRAHAHAALVTARAAGVREPRSRRRTRWLCCRSFV